MPDPQKSDKDLAFIGTSRKDLAKLIEPVRRAFGHTLRKVQQGKTPANAAPFPQGGAGCMELKEDHDKATYRTMYVAKFADAIYVLHAFQKKSKAGIATPQKDIDLVRERYRLAEQESKMKLAGTKVRHK